MKNKHTNEDVKLLSNLVNPALSGLLVAAYVNNTVVTFATYRQRTLQLATFLKLSTIFKSVNPVDCQVIDSIETTFRFTIIYTVQNVKQNSLIRIVTKTNDLLPLISLQSVYPGFNWAEREAWDMLGIFFINHPDLRRILTYYGFGGHPLRKDFPLSVFREVHYDDSTKHVEYHLLELPQSYRVLNLLNPWTGEKKI